MTTPNPRPSSVGRASQAGMFFAAAVAPRTFDRTLMPRSNMDQGVITGLAMGLQYGLGELIQETIEGIAASWTHRNRMDTVAEVDDQGLRRATMMADLAAIGLGLALQKGLGEVPNEPKTRAAMRTTAYLLTEGAVAGFGAGFVQDLLHTIDRSRPRDHGYRRLPFGLIGGGMLAGVAEYTRRLREKRAFSFGADQLETRNWNIGLGPSVLLSAGVSGVLMGLATAERMLAFIVGEALASGLPGDQRIWRGAGHLAALGALGGAVVGVLDNVNYRMEAGTTRMEAGSDTAPASKFVSGGTGSGVRWATLGREGRRHVASVLSSDQIENVMGERAVADPIRVYVGLDSGRSEAERISLAVQELERTGAFERSLLLVVSPTGTGYVNYVTSESIEYLTLGDCASATLQYSKRPSALSLDRVWEGRKHFRLVLSAIRRRLYQLAPEKRPRLVVFGESLGALTSQDAFVHQGTVGLLDAGVEAALWIGTPALSKWKQQVTGPARLDVDAGLIGEFDNMGQLQSLDEQARARLRYVMLTHWNDGVGLFDPDLLIQKPPWLRDADMRPPSVPRSMKWTSPTTFLQTMIDMKNAMGTDPSEFVARGHDYRADLPRFLGHVFGLPCREDQMVRIEEAVRAAEHRRRALLEPDAEHTPEQLGAGTAAPAPNSASRATSPIS